MMSLSVVFHLDSWKPGPELPYSFCLIEWEQCALGRVDEKLGEV